MSSSKWIYAWMWIQILTFAGRPKCTNHNENEVVCFADTADYKLERGLVSDNNKTTSIILRNCRINEIEYEAFENLDNLQKLDLSQNKIQVLKLGVLDGFQKLTYLNMSYNHITGFPLGLFDQKPNLKVLDLKGNKIRSLTLGVFDPLKKLTHVDLSSNKLKGYDFDAYIFDESPHITFMDFSRNDMNSAPIHILHAFQNVKFLNLDRCSLDRVPNFINQSNLDTMVHLILSSNKIELLSDRSFDKLVNLEILNLAYNMIRNIAMDIKWPSKLKMIILRHNLLNNIPEKLFQNLPNLSHLDLSFNKLKFIPVNAFKGTALKVLNLSENQITFLPNNFSTVLRTSGIYLSKFYFDNNPWQCWCLHELLKEVNRYNIKYSTTRYNGLTPVCVISDQSNCVRNEDLARII